MLNKKVLVTGSSSFTGHYVVNELKLAGYEVGDEINDFVDLRDYDSVLSLVNSIRPNYVIHLAALSFVGCDNVNKIYETNLLGTINLLRALDESELNLHKVILASSANIYGNVESDKISEGQPPNPVSHYGISKYSMEMAANQWRGRLPILITRPFNYTGVGQAEHFLVPKIVKHFQQKKQVIELGNIDVFRDFSDVRDISRWYVQLLGSTEVVLNINLCSGKLTSLRDIIDGLCVIAEYKIMVKVNPDFVRDNEIKILCGDNTLLQSMVNKNETKSITATLQWMYYN